MKIGCVDLFQAMLGKIGFSLGSRAICSFLLTIGCSGGLTLALGFAVRALFSGGTEVRCWMDNLTLYVGGGGSSSKEPSLPDLNLPPAPEPEPDPAETSELPKEEVALRRQMEEHLFRRLIDKSPPGSDPNQLLKQARETAQLKRQIVDHMPELDPDHSDFWRTHRYSCITDCLLTNRQADYAPHHLRQMLVGLRKPNSRILRKMFTIRSHFFEKGTFKC